MQLEMQTYIRFYIKKRGAPYSRLKSRACGAHLVNVFIGSNGSGKTTILEAIGLLCAAMTDRVDNASMQRKGVRLSVPGLYKSAFSDLKRKVPTINFDEYGAHTPSISFTFGRG